MNLSVPEITPIRPDGDHSRVDVRWRLARKDPESAHTSGSMLIGTAAWLLSILAAGLLFVSFSGQYTYIWRARHQHASSLIESAMFDIGMIIFSLLALGLARAGKPARTERTLIMACSFGSAAMNYAAADTASPRSVIAYVTAPVFLAIVVDRVVAVIRRHVLGDDEGSAWTALGGAVVNAAKLAGLIMLYSLRTVLAPAETAGGLRRMVLAAAPVPGEAVQPIDGEPWTVDVAGRDPGVPPVAENPETADDNPVVLPNKKDRLLTLYRGHRDYGNRAKVSQVAGQLAPFADLQAGTARTYLYGEIDGQRAKLGGAQ